MEAIQRTFAKHCAQLRFGSIALPAAQNAFRHGLNREILDVIQSLPERVQTQTALMLTRHLGLSFGTGMDFFKVFYPPAWSLLYWIPVVFAHGREIPREDMRKYQAVHAIAMLLHLLDDHLNDGDLPSDHLALLLRSQLWMALHRVLGDLTAGNDRDADLVRHHIDTYYAGVDGPRRKDSLAAYCRQFKQQLAFGHIAPALLARRTTGDEQLVEAIQAMLEAFGCAWRLLDDIHDITDDVLTETPSSVFLCLPERIQRRWSGRLDEPGDAHNLSVIIATIVGEGILDRLVERICRELDRAAAIAEAVNLKACARELTTLAAPLRQLPAGHVFPQGEQKCCRRPGMPD